MERKGSQWPFCLLILCSLGRQWNALTTDKMIDGKFSYVSKEKNYMTEEWWIYFLHYFKHTMFLSTYTLKEFHPGQTRTQKYFSGEHLKSILEFDKNHVGIN